MAAPRLVDSSAILADVASHIGSTLDLDRLAAQVVEHLVTLLGAERALFALLDHTSEVEHVVTHGFDDWPGLPAPLPMSHTALTQAVRTRALVVESAPAHGDARWSARSSVRALHLRFLFAMPVEVRGQVVGVLYCDSRQSALGPVADVESTLTALARMVGAAVDNARLWEEAAFRNLLLARMVHDLALPVSAVQMNAASLVRGGASAAEVVDVALDIASATARMNELIRSTLLLARGGPPEGPPPTFAVSALVRDQLAALDDVRRAARVGLVVSLQPDLPPVVAYPERARSALANLLFNALKFAPEGSAVEVSARLRDDAGPAEVRDLRPGRGVYLFRRATNLRARPERGFVELSVRSGGRPIPPEARRRIFHPWTRLSVDAPPPPLGPPSAGLGLAIVEQSVRSLGGLAWVDCPPGGGNVFRFTVPVVGEPIT